MTYLLDTNAVIHVVRGYPDSVRQRLDWEGPGRVCVSSVTVAELWYGAAKSESPERRRQRLFEAFLAPFEVAAFDAAASKLHGTLRHLLRHRPIGERDLLVAAIARSRGLTLVTGNLAEFECVPGLALEDWSVSVA